MSYKKKVSAVLFLLLCFVSVFGWSQTVSKVERLKKLYQPSPKEKSNLYLKQSTNELEGTAALLFAGYKTFVSSQDMANCVFHPSCSAYAMQSIQKDNPVKAYLKIFDRLTRCHPMIKQGQYIQNKKTGLYHDPVR